MLVYDPDANQITIDNITLRARTGFPPSNESTTPFQSKEHYVRLKGKRDLEFGTFFYSYTKEGWYRRNTVERVNHVEYWY